MCQPDYNSLDFGRELTMRVDPQNDTTNMELYNIILHPKPIKDLKELNSRLARWEKLQRDYVRKSGEEAINQST